MIWRDAAGNPHFMGQYGWGGLESFPIPGDYDGDGTMVRGFYRYAQNWWFLEGEPDFFWGWDGGNFMPITSQMAGLQLVPVQAGKVSVKIGTGAWLKRGDRPENIYVFCPPNNCFLNAVKKRRIET